MSADKDSGAEPIQARAGDGGVPHVDARQAVGVQVGKYNTQIIYSYGRLTWADESALPPLVSVSGKVDSPYRGLRAFEERDAPFFFGREVPTADIVKRMSKCAGGTGLLVVSGVSEQGSRRCCGPACCRRSAVQGWKRPLRRHGGRACCSHLDRRRWTCWPSRWHTWPASMRPRCGAG
jgi:hypothetical protein